MSVEIKYLHIFAQFTHHADARIVGNRGGLAALAEAVAGAMQHGEARSEAVFVNDGEGFSVEVQCLSGGDVEQLGDPYYSTFVSDDIAYWRNRAFNAEIELSKLRKSATQGAPE